MNSYERYMAMVKGQKVDIVPRIPILMHFAADHINASYADFARDYKVMCKANIEFVKIGAKVVSHARYVTFQMAEVLVSRSLFYEILERIKRLKTIPVGYD